MTEDRDEVIERITDLLRPLPPVNLEAKARLLVAIAAERQRGRESAAADVRPFRLRRWLLPATIAAAAVFAFVLAPVPQRVVPATASARPDAVAGSTQLVGASAEALEVAKRPVQLVLRAPNAKTVYVVGDFNGWNKTENAMTRDEASGLWSGMPLMRPGRHVYAFVVDDTLWMRDPRAEAAPDADFGRPGSVVLVGRP